MVLTFESVGEILKLTIQMKATEQYFGGAFYYGSKGVLTFQSVDD